MAANIYNTACDMECEILNKALYMKSSWICCLYLCIFRMVEGQIVLSPLHLLPQSQPYLSSIEGDNLSEELLLGAYHHCVLSINVSDSSSRPLIGTCSVAGYSEGYGAMVTFNSVVDIAQYGDRYIVIADMKNHCLRILQREYTIVETLAGKCLVSGNKDGDALSSSLLTYPSSVAYDDTSKVLYFSDQNRIRRYFFLTRLVNTIGQKSSNINALAFYWNKLLFSFDNGVEMYTTISDKFSSISALDTVDGKTPTTGSFLDRPYHMTFLVRDVALLTDFFNHKIWLLDMLQGTTTQLCASCWLNGPKCVTKVKDRLYLADNNGIYSGMLSVDHCAAPNETQFATIYPNASKYPYGSLVQYKCYNGFRIIRGNTSLECLSSSVPTKQLFWRGIVPTCSYLTCLAPVLSNGVAFSSERLYSYMYGSSVILNCTEGYLYESGDLNLTCSSSKDGKAIWIGLPLTCRSDRSMPSLTTPSAIQGTQGGCPSPPSKAFLSQESVNGSLNVVKYSCTGGMTKAYGDDNISCVYNETLNSFYWSGEPPTCGFTTWSVIGMTIGSLAIVTMVITAAVCLCKKYCRTKKTATAVVPFTNPLKADSRGETEQDG